MRVLILSVTAGFGHHATAKAIGDMLESKGAEVHTLDVYAYISNLIKTTIDKGYLFSSKHMQTLYRLVYQLAENNGASYFNSAPSIINIINALGASKFAKVIANHAVMLSSVRTFFAAQMVDELKKRKNSPISRPSALLPTTRSTRTGRMCRACSTSSPRVNCSLTAVYSAAFRRTASCRSAFRCTRNSTKSCPARTRRHSSALTRK